MKILCTFLVLLTAGAALAEKYEFERYQVILDRQPFGAPPPGFDPTVPPNEATASRGIGGEAELTLTQEQQLIQSNVRFSVINLGEDGTPSVGFTDSTDPKAPRHYYLKVGESRDGWTVREADAITHSMTLVKGEVEVTLKLGENSAGGAKAAKGAAPSPLLAAGGGSLRARRSQREQQAAAEAARVAAENARKAEEDRAERAEQAERDAVMRQELSNMSEQLRQMREQREAAKAEAEAAAAAESQAEE